MKQQYLIPLNKHKIQCLCFEKPKKLNIDATHIAVCFSITGVRKKSFRDSDCLTFIKNKS